MDQIRQVRETDDFEAIYNLVNGTLRRYHGSNQITDGRFAEGFKAGYGLPDSYGTGFVAERDGRLVAFMGAKSSSISSNGIIDCGYLENHEELLASLLERCIPVIQSLGGSKLFRFVPTKFGQVRNPGISLWEKLGFRPDEYARITIMLNLKDWKEPEEFHSTGIEPAQSLDYEEIKNFLIEDGEDAIAELFDKQYVAGHRANPDQVILTLREPQSNEVAGIAYYRVILANKGTGNEFFDISAFGLHIRPAFTIDRKEIRRFLQGCLLSMKQLEAQHVFTYMTLRHFDIFAAMVAEGFQEIELGSPNTIRLYKNI